MPVCSCRYHQVCCEGCISCTRNLLHIMTFLWAQREMSFTLAHLMALSWRRKRMQRRVKHNTISAASVRTAACIDADIMERYLINGLLVLHKIAIQKLMKPTFWHWILYMLADPLIEPLIEVSKGVSATGFQSLMHRLQPCHKLTVELCARLTCIYAGSMIPSLLLTAPCSPYTII